MRPSLFGFFLFIMNIVLLDPRQTESEVWSISDKRQLEHLHRHLELKAGDTLRVEYKTESVTLRKWLMFLKQLYA